MTETWATERAKGLPDKAKDKTSILMLPTVRCQLRCPYCQWHFKGNKTGGQLTMAGGAQWKIGHELTWEDWILHLTKFAPFHIELAGGEPTLWEDINAFVQHLPEGCTWGITTNGLELPFDDICSPNCLGYSVSFHLPYARADGGYVRRVFNTARELQRRGVGYAFKFSFVVTPKLMTDAERWTKEISQWGYPIHYNAASLVEGLDWDEHPDEFARLKELAGPGFLEYPWKWERFPVYTRCTAGDDKYFFLMPDGNVLRCHSQIYWMDSQPIGHIETWRPEQGMRPCGKPHLWVCDDRSTEKE